jgi:dynactin complex subunit
MGKDRSSDRQSRLKQQIAASTEELRQLLQKSTLDDFQNFWRKKLEASLCDLRQELRALEADDRSLNPVPKFAAD